MVQQNQSNCPFRSTLTNLNSCLSHESAFYAFLYCALVPPPTKIFSQERGILSTLLLVPPQTFAAAEIFNFESFGAYPIMPLKSYSTAIMMRTALKTLQTWPSMLSMLQDAVFTFRPLSSEHRILAIQLFSLEKRLSLPIWDTLPFCLHLSQAASGFPQSRPLAKAARAALTHYHTHIAALILADRPLNGGQTIMDNALTPILYPDPSTNPLSDAPFALLQTTQPPPPTTSTTSDKRSYSYQGILLLLF